MLDERIRPLRSDRASGARDAFVITLSERLTVTRLGESLVITLKARVVVVASVPAFEDITVGTRSFSNCNFRGPIPPNMASPGFGRWSDCLLDRVRTLRVDAKGW